MNLKFLLNDESIEIEHGHPTLYVTREKGVEGETEVMLSYSYDEDGNITSIREDFTVTDEDDDVEYYIININFEYEKVK